MRDEATGPGTFKGTVVKPTRFTACTHPIGQLMWQISGAGAAYAGTHIWYHSDCSEDPGGQSTWQITSTDPANYTLRFCTVAPGGGPPTFDPAGAPTLLSRRRNMGEHEVEVVLLAPYVVRHHSPPPNLVSSSTS